MRAESIIPDNPQMKGKVEKLGQILHCIVNVLFKDSGFAIWFWVELILTANYVQNGEPVASCDITPFEADTERPTKHDYTIGGIMKTMCKKYN